MTAEKAERTDKFLWFVRLFKSRSTATEECRRGRVMVAGHAVKPAHMVSVGDTLIIRKPPVTYTYKIISLPKSRVGAKLVSDYITDLTPAEEKDRLTAGKTISGYRPRGSGRPTKRERRELEDFLE